MSSEKKLHLPPWQRCQRMVASGGLDPGSRHWFGILTVGGTRYMSKKLVLAGALAGVAAMGWLGYTQPSNAG